MQQSIRPRRNRKTDAIRRMIRETHLNAAQLVLPIFVVEGECKRLAISSMPGIFRLSIDEALKECEDAQKLGIAAIALFPVIDESKKDPFGKESLNENGLLQRTVKEINKKIPELTIITDVALDPYSSDGHDGVVKDGKILNDPSLALLAAMAVSQARAGADMVAPSDMMDGRVAAIRKALDSAGFEDVGILSYSVKYASSFYGPFREALDSAPRSGDKKTYQMDPANSREAIREAKLDAEEGADMLMVKPAGAYLDIIAKLKAESNLPIVAYQVSGEFAMIKAAAQQGWLNEKAAMEESLLAIRRAGADLIFTYFAKEMARALK